MLGSCYSPLGAIAALDTHVALCATLSWDVPRTFAEEPSRAAPQSSSWQSTGMDSDSWHCIKGLKVWASLADAML